jgi:hypothetical protein
MTAAKNQLERRAIGLILCIALVTFCLPMVNLYGPFPTTQSISGYDLEGGLARLQGTLGNGPATGVPREDTVSASAGQGAQTVHVAPQAPLSLRLAWLASLFIFGALGFAILALLDIFSVHKGTGLLGFAGGLCGAAAIAHVMVMNMDLRAWLAGFTQSETFGVKDSAFVAMRAIMIRSVQMTPGVGLYVLTTCMFAVGLLSVSGAIPRVGQVMRHSVRVDVTKPVLIRPADPRNPEEVCTTVNISADGMFFLAALQHYYPGMEVYVTRDLSDAKAPLEHGSVVRVEKRPDGKCGVAIRIFSVV